jgi:hypothetical protein
MNDVVGKLAQPQPHCVRLQRHNLRPDAVQRQRSVIDGFNRQHDERPAAVSAALTACCAYARSCDNRFNHSGVARSCALPGLTPASKR